jgi:hypothetical protein
MTIIKYTTFRETITNIMFRLDIIPREFSHLSVLDSRESARLQTILMMWHNIKVIMIFRTEGNSNPNISKRRAVFAFAS